MNLVQEYGWLKRLSLISIFSYSKHYHQIGRLRNYMWIIKFIVAVEYMCKRIMAFHELDGLSLSKRMIKVCG